MENWEKDLREQLGVLKDDTLSNLVDNMPGKTKDYILSPISNYVCKACAAKDRNFYLTVIFVLFACFIYLYNHKTNNSVVNFFASIPSIFAKEDVVEAPKNPINKTIYYQWDDNKKVYVPVAAPKIPKAPKVEKNTEPKVPQPKIEPKNPEIKSELKQIDEMSKTIKDLERQIIILRERIFAIGIQSNNNWSVISQEAAKSNLIYLNHDYSLNQMPKHLSGIGPVEQKELNRLVKPSTVK